MNTTTSTSTQPRTRHHHRSGALLASLLAATILVMGLAGARPAEASQEFANWRLEVRGPTTGWTADITVEKTSDRAFNATTFTGSLADAQRKLFSWTLIGSDYDRYGYVIWKIDLHDAAGALRGTLRYSSAASWDLQHAQMTDVDYHLESVEGAGIHDDCQWGNFNPLMIAVDG